MTQREQDVQNAIRLAAAESRQVILWRNNTGALKDASGRLIRYGLGNDSAAVNKIFKSSDLIGIRPLRIRPDHVDLTVGVFTAIEVKRPGWTVNDRSEAQRNWLELVGQWGGLAGFATSVDEARSIWWV